MTVETDLEIAAVIYAGDDFVLTINAQLPSGTVIDLSGVSIELSIYAYDGFTYTGEALIEKTTDDDITITNAAGGIFTVELSATETEALSVGLYYVISRITTVATKKGSLKPFLIKLVQTPLLAA